MKDASVAGGGDRVVVAAVNRITPTVHVAQHDRSCFDFGMCFPQSCSGSSIIFIIAQQFDAVACGRAACKRMAPGLIAEAKTSRTKILMRIPIA